MMNYTTNVEKILNLLKRNTGITTKQISKEIELSYGNTSNHIQKLKKAGIINIFKHATKKGIENKIVLNEMTNANTDGQER